MPKQQPPRLWLKPAQAGRAAAWIIKDGTTRFSTGCSEERRGEAEQALAAYISQKFKPDAGQNNPGEISIAEVLTFYVREKRTTHPELIKYHVKALIPFWGDKMLGELTASLCREYVRFREQQGRKAPTAGRELKTLRAAIGLWYKDLPFEVQPRRGFIELPKASPPRQRFLERWEAARLLRAARRLGYEHIARFLLLGLYTGSRHAAILGLRWSRSSEHGYVDLERGHLYRRGEQEAITNKGRPTVSMPINIVAHLKRWRLLDLKRGIRDGIVHWNGKAIDKLHTDRAWGSVVKAAGLERPDEIIPHMLRHTCITWLCWSGMNLPDIGGYVGADVAMLTEVYAHHRDYFARPESRKMRWARA